MKTVHLDQEKPSLADIMHFAEQEPLLLIAANGKTYILTEADDFEAEVNLLRASQTFQRFLDQRMASPGRRRRLDDIEADIERELASLSHKPVYRVNESNIPT